jgi:hypothetical protein
MTLLFRKNRRFLRRRGLVRRDPVTSVYSHDRIAKKKAPIASSEAAFSAAVAKGMVACSCMSKRMEAVIAFCCSTFLSRVL